MKCVTCHYNKNINKINSIFSLSKDMAQRLFTPTTIRCALLAPTTIRPCPIHPHVNSPVPYSPPLFENDPYSHTVLFTPSAIQPVWFYIVDEYNCVSIKVFYLL